MIRISKNDEGPPESCSAILSQVINGIGTLKMATYFKAGVGKANVARASGQIVHELEGDSIS
jgi:hypothetical protein